MVNQVEILDCTIRDGSYATHYYWKPEVLQKIVTTLAECGIRYIEIGNGTGMGAYRTIDGALDDASYYINTIPHKGDAKIGSFFISNVGTIDDLKMFRDAGGDFVRVGCNATETSSAVDAIRQAKQLGLMTCCNLMKTYAINKFELIQNTQSIIEAGADYIYIVDSAGSMLPEQVSEYMQAMLEFYPNVKLGFHGHNNLLLANANSLQAARSGAQLIDATLYGLGRGAGNAQLESMAVIMQKAGLRMEDCNVWKLSDLAQDVLSEMHNLKGSSKREITIGAAQFHDSNTAMLEQVANQYQVDPNQLMVEVCKINIINPSKELFEFAAQKLKEGQTVEHFAPRYYHKKL